MLVHVSVKDIALIDRVEISFEPGFTVLTGETGAGKSILVEALLLLLGARASAEQVRAGAAEGTVEAQLALAGADAREVARLLEDNGLPALEGDALVLRRVISREGRHKQFVNGALATVAQLKAVAEPLVDFTGQHAHQALVRAGAAEGLLDAFGGHEDLVREMTDAHRRMRALAAELLELQQRNAEKERRLDVIRFYLDEIDRVAPELGEDERVAASARRLKNAESVRGAIAEAREALVDGSDDAATLVARALAALKRAAKDDPALTPLCASLEEAAALVDDVGRTLHKTATLEADPERLRELDDRLDALKRLMKKHGGDLASVLRARADLAAERATLEGATERIEQLEKDRGAAVDDALACAGRLTARRKTAAKKLAAAVEGEVVPLGMPDAAMRVSVEPRDDGALSSTGADRVEILFSANQGEAPAPLSKVASGGELSRVLLAVKRALLVKDPVPVSIFDEVDAGVGGAVADAIGDKLRAVAAGRQVLVISHLPQIAAKADHHVVVVKALEGGRTVSRVRALDDAGRVDELSRMLGGKEITQATRKHAEDMLERGRRVEKKRKTA